MNVIIIEDEKLSAEHLANLLHKIDAEINIVTTIDSIQQSVALLKNGLQADVIFLDIHLADGLSFEIFNAVDINIPIIFTTAYSEYAIKAFELNSIAYLLKPIDIAELEKAIAKFKKFKPQYSSSIINNLLSTYEQQIQSTKNRFLVKNGQNIESVPTTLVHYFITQESISFLVKTDGKKFAVDYTLDQLQEILPTDSFFRINRKVILNITAIQKVNTFFNSRLAITANNLNDEACIVSRERVADFKAWLDK